MRIARTEDGLGVWADSRVLANLATYGVAALISVLPGPQGYLLLHALGPECAFLEEETLRFSLRGRFLVARLEDPEEPCARGSSRRWAEAWRCTCSSKASA